MENDLFNAILQKRIVTFVYNSEDRVCETHVFGVANQKNQILCYQLSGGSIRGGIPEWRRFDVSGIEDLKLTEETFPGPRPMPKGPHSIWERVILVVS